MSGHPREFQPYLAATPIIAADHPRVRSLAAELRGAGDGSAADTTRRCFEYVRDRVRHSWDHRADAHNPLTCAAPQVLAEGTGYCYAKSHLLAALLRANDLPAALCYQRLVLEPGSGRYCLHGLNAVHLPGHGWYRLDPRGNKPGVAAAFAPPREQLAFALDDPGERNFPGLYPEPLAAIRELLQQCASVQEAMEKIPDAPALPPAPLNLPLKER